MPARLPLAGLLTCAALACAPLASSALAQTPPPEDGGWAGRPRDGEFRQRMEARRQQREAELRAALKLRPDQEPLFADYVGAAGGLRGSLPTAGEDGAAVTLPQRLERMRARLRDQQAAFERYAAAATRLYAVLDAPQRQTLDLFSASTGRGAGRERGAPRGED